MTERNDGGPAFPTKEWEKCMSLRDWFAGKAMQGLIVSDTKDVMSWETCSDAAYKAADAMLKAREAKQ